MSTNNTMKGLNWLTVERVGNILKEIEKNECIRVNSVASNAATASGDNYMSEIVRVNVEYAIDRSDENKVSRKRTLILKIAPEKGSSAADLAAKCAVFETEIEMAETLKTMKEILNEKNHYLSPRVFYSSLGDPSFLVMEDLAQLGFRMADRQAGLDLDHCLAVMRGLAKFHATSVAAYEKNPKVINSIRKGIYYDEGPEEVTKFVNDGIKTLGNEIAKWPELDPCYSKKILKLSEFGYEKGIECARPKDDEFNVINHGDCWVNNIMFRYDNEGRVIDNIFVDFQISVWSSPAVDLLYFFGTSLNDDVFYNNRESLIDEYMKTLVQTMLRINCRTKPPSSESLRKCLKEREFLSVLSASLALPFILVDKSDVVSLSDMLDSDTSFVHPGYRSQIFRKIISKRLKMWNSQGLLDL